MPRIGRKMYPLAMEYLADWADQGFSNHANKRTIIKALAEAWDAQRPFRPAGSIDALWISKWFAPKYRGIGDNTRRQYGAIIKQFINWGADRDYFDRNATLFSRGKTSSGRVKAPVYLEADIIQDAYEKMLPYYRGLVAFTFLSIMRGSEVRSARIGDINWSSGTINVRRIKTRTDDYIMMSDDLIEELELYLEWYEEKIGRKPSANMWLFPRFARNYGGERLYPVEQRAAIDETVKRELLKNIPPDTLTPEQHNGMGGHTLRRSGARHMFMSLTAAGDVDDPLGAVQAQGGWTERATAELYISTSPAKASRDKAFRGRRFTKVKRPELTVVRDAEAG